MTGSATPFGRSQPRRDGPSRPFAFSVGRQPNPPGWVPSTTTSRRRHHAGTPHRALVAMSFSSPFTAWPAAVRGQRPASQPSPAVPHRPAALVRFSTRPLGRRWLWDSRDEVPTLRANAGPAVLWAHLLVTRAAGVQVQFPTPAPLAFSPSSPPWSSGDWTFLVSSPYF